MPGMRRADRRNSNDDNALKYPQSRSQEPTSTHELKQLLTTVRAQRDEAQAETEKIRQLQQEIATQLVYVKQEFQSSEAQRQEWEERAIQADRLYLIERQNHYSILGLYDEEKDRANELLHKYEEADSLQSKYLTLYNEAQEQLKVERRSKASIKGWETRRKLENQHLKQEIAEMALLLRDSLERKDEAVNSLYTLAERMDKIQQLVDSVEDESNTTPVGLLQKLSRVWNTIKEILAE